jgi:hypothetical protein
MLPGRNKIANNPATASLALKILIYQPLRKKRITYLYSPLLLKRIFKIKRSNFHWESRLNERAVRIGENHIHAIANTAAEYEWRILPKLFF